MKVDRVATEDEDDQGDEAMEAAMTGKHTIPGKAAGNSGGGGARAAENGRRQETHRWRTIADQTRSGSQCLSSHHLIVLLLLIVVAAESRGCKVQDPVTAVQNSAVTLRCPLSSPQPGITQVFWEAVYGNTAERINQCPPSCPPAGNNNRTQLCERVRTVQDNATGTETLTIIPVNSQDALWYRCTVQTGNVKYCSEVKLKVKDEPLVEHLTKDCTIFGLFEAVVNSTFTYSAPVPHPEATQIVWGINEGDQVVPITRCPSLCTSSRTRRPLCERVQTVEDAASGKSSLTISPVKITDSSWLSFIVNASSCYTFKLNVKGFSHPTPSPQTLPTQPTNTEETKCAGKKREERGMQHGTCSQGVEEADGSADLYENVAM
ncbi:hypothetical protein AMEX_G2332 [Astyanax mexicanus]|uniref:Ig-like domain-containing protein n=1 Tax=Astyanax mexicanus TaxID=7994 RepID=A0A8T2MHP1_ASTMX|nr:hypothetical protein AMEX_G2332 [Astyanax mexicanus]